MGIPVALLGLLFSSRDASDTMERDMVRVMSSFIILMTLLGKVGLGTGLVIWLFYRGADVGADSCVGQRSFVRYYQFVKFIIQIRRNFSIGQQKFLPADP